MLFTICASAPKMQCHQSHVLCYAVIDSVSLLYTTHIVVCACYYCIATGLGNIIVRCCGQVSIVTVFTYMQIIVVCFMTEYILLLFLSQVRSVTTGYMHSLSAVNNNYKATVDSMFEEDNHCPEVVIYYYFRWDIFSHKFLHNLT